MHNDLSYPPIGPECNWQRIAGFDLHNKLALIFTISLDAPLVLFMFYLHFLLFHFHLSPKENYVIISYCPIMRIWVILITCNISNIIYPITYIIYAQSILYFRYNWNIVSYILFWKLNLVLYVQYIFDGQSHLWYDIEWVHYVYAV